MDYGTLANLSNPGKDPYGPVSAERVQRWDTLNNINQQALGGGQQLAGMDLQMQQQKLAEMQAGAPGRMDQITLANMTAADAVKPESFEKAKKLKELAEAVKDKELSAKLNEQLSEITPYGAGYTKATPEEKQKILGSLNGRKLNNHTFGQDPVKDDMVLETAGLVAHNAPQVQVKKDVAATNVAGRVEVAKTGAMSREKVAGINAAVRKELEAAKAAIAANKPLSGSQAEAASVVAAARKLSEETGQDPDQLVAQHFFMKSQGAQFMKELQKSQTMQGLGVNTPTPEATSSPVAKTPITKKAAPKGAMDIKQATSILESAKGKPNEEAIVKFFVDTYGADKLPAWAKKK